MVYQSDKTNQIGGVEVGGDHASLAACAAWELAIDRSRSKG